MYASITTHASAKEPALVQTRSRLRNDVRGQLRNSHALILSVGHEAHLQIVLDEVSAEMLRAAMIVAVQDMATWKWDTHEQEA